MMTDEKKEHGRFKDPRLDDPAHMLHIMFSGSQTLWRTSTNLDLLFVHHKLNDCIEVVSYEPNLDTEAPRIYLSVPKLFEHVRTDEFNAKVEEAHELMIRRKKDFDAKEVELDIHYTFATNYILSHIAVENHDSAAKFRVYLQPKYGDKVSGNPIIPLGNVDYLTLFCIYYLCCSY